MDEQGFSFDAVKDSLVLSTLEWEEYKASISGTFPGVELEHVGEPPELPVLVRTAVYGRANLEDETAFQVAIHLFVTVQEADKLVLAADLISEKEEEDWTVGIEGRIYPQEGLEEKENHPEEAV
jgi:hypothetical protein